MGLESNTVPDFFSPVRGNSIQIGVIAGALAASATTGALVAMGRRLGSAGLAFDAIGRSFTGGPRSIIGVSAAAVIVGIVIHFTIAIFWSIVGARLTLRWRGRMLLASLAATVAWFSTSWVFARLTGRGLSTLLLLGDHIVLALVFVLALVVGMRFAFSMRARM